METRKHGWASALARRLSAAGGTPNGISIFGVFAGATAAAMFAASRQAGSEAWCGGALLLAAGFTQLRLLSNMLDGLVAVECGKGGPTGDFFNEVPDRLEDGLILGAAGWAAGWPLLGAVAAWLALATAYLRAYRASRGLGQDFRGPGAKPHRMFVVTVGALAAAGACFAGERAAVPSILVWTLGVVVVLSAVTVVRRAFGVYRAMREQTVSKVS